MSSKSINESIILLKNNLENTAQLYSELLPASDTSPKQEEANIIASLLALDEYLSKLARELHVALPKTDDSIIEILEQVVNPYV
ncbi:hypothetical protein [Ahrensia marina]|uniref:Uncharacterized protein n=1 Tax=Ahrensia marina TaxID=1514904 RepID=A0A0N0E7M9_9HYPH|nr:hypothetical protein [Ahrensia marina]KPB01368.1 hypothetical protein SU32_08960 [Ahrensia marina]